MQLSTEQSSIQDKEQIFLLAMCFFFVDNHLHLFFPMSVVFLIMQMLPMLAAYGPLNK